MTRLLPGITASCTAVLWFLACCLQSLPVAAAETTPSLFESHQGALFQIKIVDTPSGDRSALGTGFAIADDLVATNYHVISQFLESPGNIAIRLIDHANNESQATVVAIDVINDLALLRSDHSLPSQLTLSNKFPQIGATLYALGNPYDLGMSVTEGIYNGIKAESFPQRVHYSGPVNAGMSGGPAVNAEGEVIGINVASAGNSVGFLVPVEALLALWETADLQELDTPKMLAQIRDQLWSSQESLMSELLELEWPQESFGGAQVPGKGADFISCWGRTAEEMKDGVDSIQRGCNSGQQIRIKQSLTSTYIEYEFAHMSSTELDSYQLYSEASAAFGHARPANRAREEDVTNYHCVEDHIVTNDGIATATRFKAIYCSRAYRELEGLYDAFYVGMTTDKSNEILFTHFTLSGFSEANIKRFLDRFVRSIHWQSS